jgi:cytochrome c
MTRRLILAIAGLGATAAAPAAGTGGDPQRGEVAFQKCYACHSVQPDETGLTGPNLSGVVGRAVASVPDFAYSNGLKTLPARGYRTWTRAALDAFLTSPDDFAPGTAMTFVGMPSAEERADVIAYLATHSAGGD